MEFYDCLPPDEISFLNENNFVLAPEVDDKDVEDVATSQSDTEEAESPAKNNSDVKKKRKLEESSGEDEKKMKKKKKKKSK